MIFPRESRPAGARHLTAGHAKIASVPIRSGYEPPDDAAAIFQRQAELNEEQAELRPRLREMAVREMRKGADGGATVGDLARLTGKSDEFFRKIAREENIPLRRPATVRSRSDKS